VLRSHARRQNDVLRSCRTTTNEYIAGIVEPQRRNGANEPPILISGPTCRGRSVRRRTPLSCRSPPKTTPCCGTFRGIKVRRDPLSWTTPRHGTCVEWTPWGWLQSVCPVAEGADVRLSRGNQALHRAVYPLYVWVRCWATHCAA
jgi:hypothetical protein